MEAAASIHEDDLGSEIAEMTRELEQLIEEVVASVQPELRCLR